MNRTGKKYSFALAMIIICVGCAYHPFSKKRFDVNDGRLSELTSIAQSAVKQGYLRGGEEAVFDYIQAKDPTILEWYRKNGYKIVISEVSNHAVIMICYKNKAILEDTNCTDGDPDKDYRNSTENIPCEVTMTEEEVNSICY